MPPIFPKALPPSPTAPRAGQTLTQVAQEWGEDLIGAAWRGKPTGGRFPLLVKFLDAQENLSVQVHPDEIACRAFFPKDFSKDESWVVLSADPGGRILYGLETGTTRNSFEQAIRSNSVIDCLQSIEVRPGEVYRVAPGTVHALCSGVLVLEIQEPSDSTFRIYDYNRPGDDGKPRLLHLEAARRVIRFEDEPPSQAVPVVSTHPWGQHELLVDCPAYRIERVEAARPVYWEVNPASAQVLVVTDGKALIVTADTSLSLKKGDCAILPARVGQVEFRPDAAPARCVISGAGGIGMVSN